MLKRHCRNEIAITNGFTDAYLHLRMEIYSSRQAVSQIDLAR